MTGEILLVRHGRVAIESDGLFSREEFLRYLEDYDAASLRADSRPPQELTERLRQTHVVFASELPRARGPAQHLSIESEIRYEALFNELP